MTSQGTLASKRNALYGRALHDAPAFSRPRIDRELSFLNCSTSPHMAGSKAPELHRNFKRTPASPAHQEWRLRDVFVALALSNE